MKMGQNVVHFRVTFRVTFCHFSALFGPIKTPLIHENVNISGKSWKSVTFGDRTDTILTGMTLLTGQRLVSEMTRHFWQSDFGSAARVIEQQSQVSIVLKRCSQSVVYETSVMTPVLTVLTISDLIVTRLRQVLTFWLLGHKFAALCDLGSRER